MIHQQNSPEQSVRRRRATYGLLVSLFLMASMLGGCHKIYYWMMEEMTSARMAKEKKTSERMAKEEMTYERMAKEKMTYERMAKEKMTSAEVATKKKMAMTKSPETVKIGFIHTTPRPKSSRYGAQLAVAQLNNEGGVHGMPIQLIVRDDKDDTERSVALAEELIKEGVSAIVGPDFSTYARPVGEVAQRHGIPMVTTYPTHPTVTDAGDFIFMAAFIDDLQAEVMAAFAIQEIGARSAAILTLKDLAYAEGLSQIFADNFTAHGGEVVAHQYYYTSEDVDFSEQLTAIAASAPDVIFFPGFLPTVPHVVQQAREMGITAIFLGGDGWDDPELISGPSIEGSFFSSGFAALAGPGALSEDSHQFIAAYTAMFGIAPDWPASLGYDAVRLVVQAMRRADDLSSEAIRDQIAATKDYSGASLIAGYDENRHAIRSIIINRISDGEIRFHQLIEP